MNRKPFVSVVIPAFNEEKYIENCLFSLLKSEQKTDINYEVVLVDNNSSDRTVQLAEKFKNGMNLRIIHEKKQGRGAARARGFADAKGKMILSADADTIFYRGWIETLASAIKGDVIAITTSCRVADLSKLSNKILNFCQPAAMILYRILIGHYWLSGFSFGILRSVYIKSGGFNPSLQSMEDVDLSFRVAKLGKIKFINKPVTFSGRRFRKGLLIGLFEYIYLFIKALVLKNKNVYQDNPR
ncbi:hypothetical protein A3C26_03915 [Candidatus Daviesbacteria bacterium RIFCSPHIGHO2_02_FULL_39_12]|uniref:Glycosyltransferase 2-like domain-containing protein n=2 Tax=Candidatus Daviesiibacteriota TaxID=1752718 RepID=A0A1F5JED2_9BACT|nr:MAG: hypothetical protein A3C26_03915 [Candidatus Daviesbacteria bacterium RIFCSPHIGHO2_02_FULL_39_12]OGE72105.1 MAG: hypothetical protein A3H40_03320 [Candidatus Daviesbacteria bacterium RIFCSPLOWO2_02_FULL_38_15]